MGQSGALSHATTLILRLPHLATSPLPRGTLAQGPRSYLPYNPTLRGTNFSNPMSTNENLPKSLPSFRPDHPLAFPPESRVDIPRAGPLGYGPMVESRKAEGQDLVRERGESLRPATPEVRLVSEIERAPTFGPDALAMFAALPRFTKEAVRG